MFELIGPRCIYFHTTFYHSSFFSNLVSVDLKPIPGAAHADV